MNWGVKSAFESLPFHSLIGKKTRNAYFSINVRVRRRYCGVVYCCGTNRKGRLNSGWGTAYFRGTLSVRCGKLAGDLALDCGQISLAEGAELARNRAAAMPP